MQQDFLDARQAWQDFYLHVRPVIWDNLSRNYRRDINTAQRDFLGQRRDRGGAVINLGPERVARLLERFAPGRYGVERLVRFWVEEPLPPPSHEGRGE